MKVQYLKLNSEFFSIGTFEKLRERKDEYAEILLSIHLKGQTMEEKLTEGSRIPYDAEKMAGMVGISDNLMKEAIENFIDIGIVELLSAEDNFKLDMEEFFGEETDIIEKDAPKNDKKSISAIVDAWNTLGLNKVQRISTSSKRYKMLKARLKEYGKDSILEAIDNIRESEFLKGNNKNGWTITFDWFVKPNNFPKVLEGNYNQKSSDAKPGIVIKNTGVYI